MLLILFSLVCAKRTTIPVHKKLFEQISDTNYVHNVDSTLLLQYNSYPGVYSMELSGLMDGEFKPIQQNVTLDPFTLPGCYQYQRRLIHKHLADQQIESDESSFTDMYIDGDAVFVTRSDNALLQFEIKLDIDNRKIVGLEFKQKYENGGFSQQHQLICYNKVCLILGEEGQTFIYKDNNTTQVNLTSIIGEFREFPKDVYFDEKSKLIYICYENSFVDVLQFTNDNRIEKVKTITAGQKIVQIRTNPESTLLYLLDQQLGLLSYKIVSVLEYIQNSFQITLQNCMAFDFYQNTFFIVAETQDGIPYALEVLSEDDSYYFNKIYSKDMDIYDVWVGEHFAILIGAEIHRVIYHSVYNKFVEQTEIPLFFQDVNLVNVEEYKKWDNTSYTEQAIEQEPFQRIPLVYKQSFMVGISSNQISVFSIKSLLPWVQCKPTSTNDTRYSLKMNSTSCLSKQKENDHTAFKQCIILHNFTITGKEILFYEEDQQKIIIFGCILVGLVILLILLAVIAIVYGNYRINLYKNLPHIQLDEQELQNVQVGSPEN
ncbi:unnamed protein product [Paramecium octaurelia]|uniref:Transmembrane protein n=1 Tax=Paramecium octaurelia TaxID=43137 RepID=A0A8S1WNK7_PAROT|nr:unnamed protein product [Paramecium octaurelia]